MANRLVEAINAVYDRFVDGAGAPTIPEPVQSDLEAILWNLAGADVDLPVADTGLEGALANLAEHADEIGGGGSNTATVTLNVDGEETTVASVTAWNFVDDNGYLNGAYDNGEGYVTEIADPIQVGAPAVETIKFMIMPEKAIAFAIFQGTVDSASGAAVYNEEASTEAGSPVYDVSGDCTFNIHTSGH